MKIMLIFGTNQELAQMTPLLKELSRRGQSFVIVSTGSQEESIDPKMVPDIFLDLTQNNQTLFDVTANILNGIGSVLYSMPNKPDWVVVHGNTTTAFAAALAAHYSNIPVAHIETGLSDQFLEDANRKLVYVIASKHFSVTDTPSSVADRLCMI